MTIEPYVCEHTKRMRFVVKAETSTDRAILGQFCETYGLDLMIGGYRYVCGVSGVTGFNFGWVEREEDTRHDLPAGLWRE